jgi:hypothetical protein
MLLIEGFCVPGGGGGGPVGGPRMALGFRLRHAGLELGEQVVILVRARSLPRKLVEVGEQKADPDADQE